MINQRTLMFSKIIGSRLAFWWSDTPQSLQNMSINSHLGMTNVMCLLPGNEGRGPQGDTGLPSGAVPGRAYVGRHDIWNKRFPVVTLGAN